MLSLFLAAASSSNCGTVFKTFYGTQISAPEANTLGFKVESNCDVTLNDKVIDKTKAFNDVGEYEFKDTDGSHKINIKAVTKTYRFYMFFATMSALLSMIEFTNHDGFPNDDIYMHFIRDSTFDIEYLKTKYPNIKKIYTGADSGTEKIYKDLQDILDKDPKAYIKIYVEDVRARYYYQFGSNVGLSSDRFDVVLSTDGSITYEVWGNVKNNFAKSKATMENNLAIAKNGNYVLVTD